MASASSLHRMSLEICSRSSSMEREVINSNNKNNNVDNKVNEVEFENGLSLTWEDLWVTVSNGKNGARPILQSATGYARPGELLAIMGPSGCGKSTLLDMLAGRLGNNTRQSGDILINGRKQRLAYGTSAYVTQDDTLTATLTVGEAIYYSALLQLPDTMSNSEKKERAECTIREMGLQDSINTRIGGWGVKGVSGGQKRRVGISIELLTRPKLLFLDEPTSGLDSAASYYVMSRIARLDRKDGVARTIVASIHQPSSEVFQLFNNLCLLSSGKTVYFGPVSGANQFFSINGFPCPTLQNPSDHFLKTINKDFEKDVEQGLDKTISAEEAIEILTNSYKSSENYQQILNSVSEIRKQDYVGIEKNKSRAGFITQSLVLTRRSFINMTRDIGYYWLRVGIYIVLALSLGSVFFHVADGYDSIQAKSSLLMYAATFITFMAIGGFPSFVEEMKVFKRERLNGHYGATAFAIGNTFSALPFLLISSLIPGAIIYYIAGLREGYTHFLYFVCVLLACVMLVESLMMIIAAVVPNFLMGIICGSGVQGLMIMTGGFFRLPNDLPNPLWKFPLYYISFHKYAYQGMYKNEFEGQKYTTNVSAGTTRVITGEEILRDNWQMEIGYSKWVDLAILLGMVVLYRFLFLIIIKAKEKIKPIRNPLMTIPSKPSSRVVINPSNTPLHEESSA
ncbi:hypothetical protein ACFE04_021877 [Oxalis oulophora]